MFGAVSDSKEKAIKFFAEHVEEVKKQVPKEKLLVWEVRLETKLGYYCLGLKIV